MLKTYVEEETELVKQLQLFPNREWVERYLDIANEVVEWVGSETAGVKLVTAIATKTRYKLHLTVNFRVVLAAYAPSEEEPEEGAIFILRPKWGRPHEIAELEHYWQYDPPPFEKDDPSYMVRLHSLDALGDPAYFKEEFKEAVLYELNRAKASSFKYWHTETAYRLIVNRDYRNTLLNQVYGTDGSTLQVIH